MNYDDRAMEAYWAETDFLEVSQKVVDRPRSRDQHVGDVGDSFGGDHINMNGSSES